MLRRKVPGPSRLGIFLGTIMVVVVAAASFFPVSTSAADYTLYDMTTDGGWRPATGSTMLAQAFVSDGSGRYLKSVRVRVRNANSTNTGSTAGTMTLSLWSSSSGAPSTKVTDLISATSVGAWSDGSFSFTAASDVDLGASAASYFIVFQGTNTVSWKCNPATPTPSTSSASFVRKISTDSGASWSDITSGSCAGEYFNMTVMSTDVSLITTTSSSTTTSTTTTSAPTTTTSRVTTTTTRGPAVAVTTTPLTPPASSSTTSTTTTAPVNAPTSRRESPQSAANLFDNTERAQFDIVASPGDPRDEVLVRISASGLVPGSPVVARVFSDPVTIVDDVASSTGTFEAEQPLPEGLDSGSHTVVLDTVTAAGEQRSLGVVTLNEQLRVESVVEPAVVSTDVQPGSRMVARAAKSGRSVYDARAQSAATAALAISAAAAISLVAGGVTSMGQSATRRRDTRGKISSFVSKKLKATGVTGEARGDVSRTWRAPLTQSTDEWSRRVPTSMGRYSAVLPRIFVDGSWMRAWSGSLFLLVWAAALGAGLLVGASGPGLLAPSAVVVVALACVGMLDAGAGFSAWTGLIIGSTVAGNMGDWYDIRTAMGLAAILTGLSPLAHVIRPLRRSLEDRGDVIERVFDYAIAPVFVAFAASSMLKSLNGLSGLELVAPGTVKSSVLIFGITCVVRFIFEDLIQHFYPKRMAGVQPAKLTSPGRNMSLLGIIPRTAIFLFVAVPFFGLTWQTILSALFLAIPLVMKPFEDDLPNSPTVNRWLPRGLLRFLCLLVFGMWLAQALVPGGDPDALRRAAVWLLVPGLLVGLVEMVGREGGEWRDVRIKWSLGFVVWAMAVGLVSGAVTLF